MRKLLLLVAFSALATSALAQDKTYVSCLVVLSGFTTDEYGSVWMTPIKEIGRFEVSQTLEEDRITKVFRLPNTRLFVVASLNYTDESMPMESGYYSAELDLALSRTRRRNIPQSVSYAAAELPANPFEIGRVWILTRIKSKARMVVMECKRMKRA
jgi:hypothetical protein